MLETQQKAASLSSRNSVLQELSTQLYQLVQAAGGRGFWKPQLGRIAVEVMQELWRKL
jgi:hypothetical protein